MTSHTTEAEVVLRPAPHSHHPHHVSGRSRRRLVVGLLAALAVAGAAGGVAALTGFLPNPVVGGDRTPPLESDDGAPAAAQVKAVRPRRDSAVEIAVEQYAVVEPFYRAELRARASGLVRAVHKDIGDRVERGELLIEIDVPELEKDVSQKDAVVDQRRQELQVSRAMVKNAAAGVDVARAVIREKEALARQADAVREFRRKHLERMKTLEKRETVQKGVIEEEERDYEAGVAAAEAAKVMIERAKADFAESEAKLEAANADISLKLSLVEVAKRDSERARAVADYTRVTAPFDGVVVRRNVDPGSFVQNATTGLTEPLISIDRADLVTAVAKFPDTVAPLVGPGTEAEVAVDGVPGPPIAARVTRSAPAINAQTQTVRVEVDLFNGDREAHARLVRKVIAAELAPLGADVWPARAAVRLAGEAGLAGLHKGAEISCPVCATGTGPADSQHRLLPGMTGTIKLLIRRFGSAYVLPSTAVYTRGGKPYILVVQNGVTKQLPVRVRVNDGRVAQVALLVRRKEAAGADRESTIELTGDELVVANRQLEIGEGLAVTPAVAGW
jgi:multidrug efflux pump subunit AcrA (membrane-fusion protein)